VLFSLVDELLGSEAACRREEEHRSVVLHGRLLLVVGVQRRPASLLALESYLHCSVMQSVTSAVSHGEYPLTSV